MKTYTPEIVKNYLVLLLQSQSHIQNQAKHPEMECFVKIVNSF